MSSQVSEAFGYIVICSAFVLLVWEWYTYRSRSEEDAWLVTKRRLRRRTLVSIVFAAIGILLAVESRGLLDIRRVPVLIIYVSTLGGFAIFLLILAMLDLADTTRNAEKHATAVMHAAIEREKRRTAAVQSGDDA